MGPQRDPLGFIGVVPPPVGGGSPCRGKRVGGRRTAAPAAQNPRLAPFEGRRGF